MADGLPPIEMEFAATGTPVVIVAEQEVASTDEVLRIAPALGDPKWVRALARVVNHLAQGDEFTVIMDPAAFQAQYMATYNAEDPDEQVPPGAVRLRNFGIPDFAAMHPPVMEGETLVYFAENLFMGIPYHVTMAKGQIPEYLPVAMTE